MFGRADCPVVEAAEAQLRQLAEGNPQGKRSAAILPTASLNIQQALGARAAGFSTPENGDSCRGILKEFLNRGFRAKSSARPHTHFEVWGRERLGNAPLSALSREISGLDNPLGGLHCYRGMGFLFPSISR